MLCYDPGVLAGSHHYHFLVTKTQQQLYYHMYWCGHFFCDSGYSIHEENYPVTMIAYVRGGTLFVEYGGRVHTVEGGSAVIVDLTRPYHYYAGEHLEFLFAGMTGVNTMAMTQHITDGEGIRVREENNEDLEKRLYALVSAYAAEQELGEAACSRHLYGILCNMAEQPRPDEKYSSYVATAVSHIEEKLSGKLSLAGIAEHVNLSPYHFSRLFKKEMGVSPMDHVMNLRMRRAIFLLKTSDMPIVEVAAAVGYENYGSFMNRFTQSVGLPPQKYRQFHI